MSQVPEMTVKKVARLFSERIRHTLTKKQLAEVVQLNAEEPENSGVCHTHDFVDSNVLMGDAMNEVFGSDRVEASLFDPEHPENAFMNALWNSAWDTARLGKFDL